MRAQALPGLVGERDGEQRYQGRPGEDAEDDPRDDHEVGDRHSTHVSADHGGGLHAHDQRALPRLRIGESVRHLVRIEDQHHQDGDRNRQDERPQRIVASLDKVRAQDHDRPETKGDA